MGIMEREAAAEWAELLALRARVAELERLQPHPAFRTGHRCARCGRDGATDVDGLCSWCDDGVSAETERDQTRAALDAARREGAEGMRAAVQAEILAAFHYNDPPDDDRARPIAPRVGELESHQTLRKLLSRVCVVRALPLDAPTAAPAPEAR